MSRMSKPKAQEGQTQPAAAASPAPGAETGPQTPATGNEGAAEAGEATAVAAPAEATAPTGDAALKPVSAEAFVLIKGPPAGRRRIGRLFGPEPVEVNLAELTEAEQKALCDDPLLTVVPRPAES